MRKSQPDEELTSPVAFRPGSNGEFVPEPRTAEDERAERAYQRVADESARRLGISRRDFVSSVGGTAAALAVINQVYGCGKRGGRFGSHNIHENYPGPCSWRSDQIIVGAFFNAGVRVYDTRNPFQPEEIAYFVPGAPKLSPKGAIQINDVFVDDRRIVFAADRFSGGLYVLEMNV